MSELIKFIAADITSEFKQLYFLAKSCARIAFAVLVLGSIWCFVAVNLPEFVLVINCVVFCFWLTALIMMISPSSHIYFES